MNHDSHEGLAGLAGLAAREAQLLDAEVEITRPVFRAPEALRIDTQTAAARRREVCAVTTTLLQTAGPGLLLPLLRVVYGPLARVDAEPGATAYVLRLPCGRSATIRPGEHPAAWAQALEGHLLERDVVHSRALVDADGVTLEAMMEHRRWLQAARCRWRIKEVR